MKYLIIGTGGVGGSIAGFLALKGKDVTCIARGEHLEAIQEQGLTLKSDLKGIHSLPIRVCHAEAYTDRADIIFVCVKGYSFDTSIISLIRRASHEKTLIIPIQNGFGMGDRLADMLPGLTVADACIYIVAYISGVGEVTQMGSIFRIVMGVRNSQPITLSVLTDLAEELRYSGVKVDLSDDIRRDTFIKWSFISATAATGVYYDVTMSALQQPGKIRETFLSLSQESSTLAHAMGISLPHDQVAYNLQVLDKMVPTSTASMQKDYKQGKQTEVETLVFDMLRRGKALGISMPTYEKIAATLGYHE